MVPSNKRCPVFAPQLAASEWTLTKWLVPVGNKVHLKQRIAMLRTESGAVDYVLAPRAGTLSRQCLSEGAVIQGDASHLHDVLICEIEYCDHSIVYRGLCAICGVDVSNLHFAEVCPTASRMPAAYNAHTLCITKDEVESVATVGCMNLLKNKRLSLVLDLDHTLVHATDDARAAAIRDYSPLDASVDSIMSFNLHPLGLSKSRASIPACTMFVKLRPHLRTFLARASKRFELSIYTMGTRPYADQIVRIIDPDNKLFRGRITSREDFKEGTLNQKNLSRLFPCDDSMVMIIDDREDVWLNEVDRVFKPNLIKCRPYHFWNGFSEAYDRASAVNGTEVTSSLNADLPKFRNVPVLDTEVNGSQDVGANNGVDSSNGCENGTFEGCNGDKQERATSKFDEDAYTNEMRRLAQEWWDRDINDDWSGHLLEIADILEDVHKQFYERVNRKEAMKHLETTGELPEFQSNVKSILGEIRRDVFKDCSFTFTGVFPRGIDPEATWWWNVSLLYGAKCSMDFESGITTHVIASPVRGASTEKSKRAVFENTAFCVSEQWLRDSVCRFERLSELSYTLHPQTNNSDWKEFRKEVDQCRLLKYEALVSGNTHANSHAGNQANIDDSPVQLRKRNGTFDDQLTESAKRLKLASSVSDERDEPTNTTPPHTAHDTVEQPVVGHVLTGDEMNDALEALI